MGTLIVEIAGSLVEDVLKTGYKQRANVVTKGLPQDAKLVDVKHKDSWVGDELIIELVFSTEKVPLDDVKTAVIEVTTFADGIEP